MKQARVSLIPFEDLEQFREGIALFSPILSNMVFDIVTIDKSWKKNF